MTTYVQHKWSHVIHIVYREFPNEGVRTECGKWYYPSQSLTPGLGGEREQDVVCAECRRKLAWRLGKKVYSQPTLRRGLSEAKRYKLRKAQQAHLERQRLEAWNRAAQEATR